MMFLVENWELILSAVAVIVVVVGSVITFFLRPSSSQMKKVKEWLLYAVISAEREIGSNNGEIKLRKIYDFFVDRFPWLALVISFEKYKKLVDEALVRMKEMLKESESAKEYIEHENEKSEVIVGEDSIKIIAKSISVDKDGIKSKVEEK